MNPVVMWCSIVQPLPPSRRATEAQFRGDDLAKGGGFVLASSFRCWFEIGLSIFIFSVFRDMIREKNTAPLVWKLVSYSHLCWQGCGSNQGHGIRVRDDATNWNGCEVCTRL